jgi:hypothetical protein
MIFLYTFIPETRGINSFSGCRFSAFSSDIISDIP